MVKWQKTAFREASGGMVVTVRSLGLSGIQGYEVSAECFISGGMPEFGIVGLPDAAVKEARDRVRAAVKNCGAKFPVSRITVNLAPAGTKKAGTVYDLPIIVGLLAAAGELPPPPRDAAFIGELSLTGAVRGIPGVLPMALCARALGIRQLFVPRENAAEATLAGGDMTVFGVSHIADLAAHLRGGEELAPEPVWTPPDDEQELPDLSDVVGQEQAKRALEIAAAGGHNLLLLGSPGAGKSMLAKRLPSILPDMTRTEALEASAVWSAAGLADPKHPLLTHRPFRSPHHSATTAAIIGGGQMLRPGEVALADHGVLFLDEFPEFRRDTLEAMRQPLEDGEVTISRAAGTVRYPARFQLICAMNPCPCGWRGHPSGRCTCTDRTVEKYVEKISGPMIDRIDLHITVPSVEYEAIRRKTKAEPSSAVKARVEAARARQRVRFSGTNVQCNAQMTTAQIAAYCRLDDAGDALMRGAFERLGLTARSHDRILRVARTIADLAGAESIEAMHLAEAIQYRNTDILKG